MRAARVERGWTQQELAHHADLAYKTVSTVENGGPCRPKTLRRIGDALGIDLSSFIGPELAEETA